MKGLISMKLSKKFFSFYLIDTVSLSINYRVNCITTIGLLLCHSLVLQEDDWAFSEMITNANSLIINFPDPSLVGITIEEGMDDNRGTNIQDKSGQPT